MKRLWRVVYGVLVVGGLAALVFIYLGAHQACVPKDDFCVTYQRGWKQDKAPAPIGLRLTRSDPNATFQYAVSKTKITGTATGLAGVLDQSLSKSVPGYHLVQSNQIVVSKSRILAVEMIYDFTPQGTTAPIRERLIVVPIKGRTYSLATQVAASNYNKVKPQLDYLLSHTEITP